MARDTLGEYGPERSGGRASTCGGVEAFKPIPYSPPKGPTNIGDRGPGLHGANLGNCGTQGTHGTMASSSGSPGLHGTNHGMGTNRRG